MTVQTGPWQGGEGQGLGPSPGLAPAALPPSPSSPQDPQPHTSRNSIIEKLRNEKSANIFQSLNCLWVMKQSKSRHLAPSRTGRKKAPS